MSYGPKKDDIYGALTVYRELAYFITRREEYQRALQYYNAAYNRNPSDRRLLLGRAWARSKVCQYDQALEDVAKALHLDPSDLTTIAHKALNTYLCCNFEDALVLNYRMIPTRKKPDHFCMGVLHCSEAIENCIGTRAGRPLRDHFKIIRKLAWKRAHEAEKPVEVIRRQHMKKKKKQQKMAKAKFVSEPVAPIKKHKPPKPPKGTETDTSEVTGIAEILTKMSKGDGERGSDESLIENSDPFLIASERLHIYDSLHSIKTESDHIPPGPRFPYRPQQRYTTNIEHYMAEKYLDKMYLDKIFLQNLKRNTGVSSPNKEGTKKILHMSKEGHKILAYKQELLRTRKPFYFIKHQEAIPSAALQGRIDMAMEKMRKMAKDAADGLLQRMREAVEMKQTQVVLETSEKLKIFCDSQHKKVLPTKEEYLQEMYELVGEAYYLLFRINKEQREWDQTKRIFSWFGAPCSKEPSTDSVLDQFKGVYIDWPKQIAVYEDRLRNSTHPEEMCWLYHELARYRIETHHFQLARVYARKCVIEGRVANNKYWIVNGMMAIARINMLQHNRNDAKAELNQTKMFANQINDETLIEYVDKCLEVVDKVDFGDFFGAKVVEKREQQIIQMMAGSGMKDEVSHLFRKMSVMPSSRRMSIMPGVRLDDNVKATAITRKMSILPGAKTTEELPAPRMVGTPIKQRGDSADGTRGIGFMKLIQYHVD